MRWTTPVEAEVISEEPGDDPGIGAEADEIEGAPAANESAAEGVDASTEYTRAALGELGKLSTAKAINNWYDHTFLEQAKKKSLSEAQIAVVDGQRKERLRQFT